MKYILKIFLLTILLIGGIYIIFYRSTGSEAKSIHIPQTQQENTSSSDCPPEGSAVREDIRALNVLKNRNRFPLDEEIDTGIHLKDILQVGDDRDRWDESKAVRIKAYISEVMPGGVETCNCKAKEKDERDTHIELVMNPMDGGALPMIAEISPVFRKIKAKDGVDWSTERIRDQYLGRWVEIEGWLLFDKEHTAQAENTSPGRPRNWRATAWEIHPVTAIRIISKPLR